MGSQMMKTSRQNSHSKMLMMLTIFFVFPLTGALLADAVCLLIASPR